MIRPMTSNVSALSGVVANGHQAIHFVSSTPFKIPYGGFSPVRLQTRLTPRPPSRAYQRHRELLTTTTSPVALGSPTGYIVQPARRLLGPHLRLCRLLGGLWIIP